MSKFVEAAFLFAIVFVVILASNFLLISAHEDAHVQINAYFGIESEASVVLFGRSETRNEPVCMPSVVRALHALNEINNYQMFVLFNSIVVLNLLFFLIFGVVMVKKVG